MNYFLEDGGSFSAPFFAIQINFENSKFGFCQALFCATFRYQCSRKTILCKPSLNILSKDTITYLWTNLLKVFKTIDISM